MVKGLGETPEVDWAGRRILNLSLSHGDIDRAASRCYVLG